MVASTTHQFKELNVNALQIILKSVPGLMGRQTGMADSLGAEDPPVGDEGASVDIDISTPDKVSIKILGVIAMVSLVAIVGFAAIAFVVYTVMSGG